MEQIGSVLRRMQKDGVLHSERIHLSVNNARVRLYNGFRYFLGNEALWIPEYEEVAKWLSNNEGRGLILMGSNGRGKSVIATKILPFFFKERGLGYMIYHASEINKKRDEVKQYKILCIDDIGIEDIANDYGEKVNVFMDLMNEVERKDKLIVITTNLNQAELEKRYTTRTTDRINSCCKVITFNGNSMRK